MTWSIFGGTSAEDWIESAAVFLINICKIKYKNIYILTLFTFKKYLT